MEGPPVEVLPELEPGDRVLLYFDQYRMDYAYKPDSPLETTVLDVTRKTIREGQGVFPGPLIRLEFEVPAEDEKATAYHMEHKVEDYGEGPVTNASDLLYEEDLMGVISNSGRVGHVATIEVLDDEADGDGVHEVPERWESALEYDHDETAGDGDEDVDMSYEL